MRRLLILLLMVVATVGLGACYHTRSLVVTAEEAIAIPGLPGAYLPTFNHMAETDSEAETAEASRRKADTATGPRAGQQTQAGEPNGNGSEGGDGLRFDRRGQFNDYVAVSGDEEMGTVRFRRLREDIYLAQLYTESLPFGRGGYDVGFVRITPRTFSLLLPVPPGMAAPPARNSAALRRWLAELGDGRYDDLVGVAADGFNVSVPDRDGGLVLDGAVGDVRRFLDAHRAWRFTEFARYHKTR